MARGEVQFEVERLLGTGGMAEVHLAWMRRAESAPVRVALKRPRGPLLDSDGARRDFEREARVCALLEHENIVRLEAFGHEARGPFLALEYVDGCSASALVAHFARMGQWLPLPAALSLACDAVRGLRHAHDFTDAQGVRRGVIHRDVSPDNLLVSRAGVARLSDFGIARLLGATRHTRTGTLKGKFGFLAPELFDDAEADACSDVFALGATLFQLLCGTPPFRGRTEAQLMRAVLAGTAPRLTALRADVPAEVDDWVHRCLSREREQRPTLEALARVLEAALAAPGGSGRRAVAACVEEVSQGAASEPRASTWGARPSTVRVDTVARTPRRWAWGVAGAGALSLLGGLGSWALQGGRAPAAPSVATEAEAALPPANVAAPSGSVAQGSTAAPDSSVTQGPTADPHGSLARGSTAAPDSARGGQEHAAATPRAPSGGRTPPSPSGVPDGAPAARTQAAEAPGKPATKSQRRPESPTSERRAQRPALLTIKVHPWGQVFVDGKLRGVTPLPGLSLPPGHHSVIVVNETLQARRVLDVTLEPGEERELKVRLDTP